MNWIKVEDALPEKDMDHVIVYCDGGNIAISYFIKNREDARKYHSREGLDKGYSRKHSNKESCNFDIAHSYSYKITHWMPKPKPPVLA